jgi:hypothetical protein
MNTDAIGGYLGLELPQYGQEWYPQALRFNRRARHSWPCFAHTPGSRLGTLVFVRQHARTTSDAEAR